jgi:undecaprenyl phosphate N,N'-diacetylbacillosamine 1-phosphate transferase
MYARFGKRLLDLILTVPALLVLTPLLLLVIALIKLDSPGPAFFLQERLGRGGRIFRVFKFRTMTDRERIPDRDIFGRDPEVTRMGYWLRRFKIDELPQLINVVLGDMSIVGPRPYLPRQLAEYDAHSRRRLDANPGLTGLTQVNGNIHLSWQERWSYDVAYVDNLSFLLDLRIIVRTALVIILGEGRFHRPLPTATHEEALERPVSPATPSKPVVVGD